MGSRGKEFKCQGKCQMDWVRFGSGFPQLDIEVEWAVFDSCDYAWTSPTAQYRREQFSGSS
jgi:hypothetical protein